jgi:hypothetical protein
MGVASEESEGTERGSAVSEISDEVTEPSSVGQVSAVTETNDLGLQSGQFSGGVPVALRINSGPAEGLRETGTEGDRVPVEEDVSDDEDAVTLPPNPPTSSPSFRTRATGWPGPLSPWTSLARIPFGFGRIRAECPDSTAS